jgi:hypothetical protein
VSKEQIEMRSRFSSYCQIAECGHPIACLY